MDIMGSRHNYEKSVWKNIARWFDNKGWHRLGNQFWDNSVAWRNKWKNLDPSQGEAFWGSSHMFVIFMDGWHVAKFMWLMHLFSAMVLFQSFSGYLLLDMICLIAAFASGHEFFFRLLQFQEDQGRNKSR